MPTYFVIIAGLVAWILLSGLVCVSVCVASARFSARLEGVEREPEAGLGLETPSGSGLRSAGVRLESIGGRAGAKTG